MKKKLTTIGMFTRQIIHIKKKHGKNVTFFFTQIVKGLHYRGLSDYSDSSDIYSLFPLGIG